jgi:EAL domain-containing protein (putative c-di-GMP-specific phosphodiesterase class I)/ActR/RegA family two-component response regulator
MRSGRNLLVIDDQRLDRAIASHAGTRAGYQSKGAATIQEARDLFEQGWRFEFVVLDLSLDREDGLEALPLIARFDKAAVVVFASGFDARILAASQRLASALGLQVAGVLRKPIMPAVLMDLLRPKAGVIHQTPDASAAALRPDDLRIAIAEGYIRPWFQPKQSLATGAIVGTEALARWVTPDGRVIPPMQFIPVAERSGLLAAMTDSMLDQSLRACAKWRRHRPDCWVAVNISPLLLDDPRLTERIDARLHAHGVPPGALVLEITETNGIPDTPIATEILTRLRIRGVNLSVDDFGTGHSSLLSLVRMPFNEMKIDQAFVREAIDNSDSRKVVRASASLGRELGLNVVAEGVETKVMADLVEDAGCHTGQGWLYGKAVPQAEFERALLETTEVDGSPKLDPVAGA